MSSNKKCTKCQAFCVDRKTGKKWRCNYPTSGLVSNVKKDAEPIKVCNGHKVLYCEHAVQYQRFVDVQEDVSARDWLDNPDARETYVKIRIKFEVTMGVCTHCGLKMSKQRPIENNERVHKAQWIERCDKLAVTMVGDRCLCTKHLEC